MAANPIEEGRVRGVITGQRLPNPRCTIDFGTNPYGTMGVYRGPIDTMQLPLKAHVQTVIHESSHAEHHHAAGLFNAQYPSDLPTVVGLAVLSEAFIGFRLLPVAGFLKFERQRINQFAGTAVAIAARFVSPADAKGPQYIRGDIMTVEIYKFLVLMLPIIVAEVTDSKSPRQFTVGLTATSRHPTVTGAGVVLLRAVQDVLRVVELAQQHSRQMVGTALSTKMTMTLVGGRLLAGLARHGIFP